MVEITVRQDSRARLSSFFATGHAGWADDGDDVVCAAVSTILQSAWLGLAEVAQVAIDAQRDKGRLELAWPPETRDEPSVRAIVATAVLSLERIAHAYPEHVRVNREIIDG